VSVGWRIALGISALWASIYALAALAGDYAFVPPPHVPRETSEAALGPAFRWASMINATIVFLVFAALMARAPKLRAGEKVGWIVAMMFLFPLVVPPFWYLHVWRAPA
jgi:hypothetical protein